MCLLQDYGIKQISFSVYISVHIRFDLERYLLNILRSSEMNKEYRVKSEQFISLSALPFYKELQLINYEDLTQDTLFI